MQYFFVSLHSEKLQNNYVSQNLFSEMFIGEDKAKEFETLSISIVICVHHGDLKCRMRKYFPDHSSGVDEYVTTPRGGISNGIYIYSAGRFYC